MILHLADVHAGEGPEKVAAALARFSIEEVRDDAAFDEGYRALDAEFGARGELERREVLAAWLAGPRVAPASWLAASACGGRPIRCRYHLLLARDEAGRLAGARDCFAAVDADAARAVVLLSHTLVLPEYRRTGLAALLRAAPAALARRAAAEDGLAPDVLEIQLVAEMEPVVPADRDTVVRLLAYGRAGFAAIPPSIFPYAQPDFRDVEALGVPAVPLPMLLVIRQVGEEPLPDISRDRTLASLRHIQAVHATECRIGDIEPICKHALAGLAAHEGASVPLVRLPRDVAQIDGLAPLLRGAVLPLYPPAWRGGAPIEAPERERQALIAAWSGSPAS